MAATTIARRGSSSYLRNLCKTLNNRPNPTSIPTSSSSSSPNLMFQITRISRSSTSRLRRDRSFMCSLLPLHTATASSRLISNLSSEMNSFEGRFVNYVSPI
ncbi:hypothetical protein FRX31_022664 [Thalictrum thalictroides]|uniref:Uncharacterized protein n=1 Tax=Thalictrum thalictroides TaxID=46969 RepID=A0A7J6VRN0_THATH|nr:hypothetical protein FRX31_022664 [Thalictrum thalictroides]